MWQKNTTYILMTIFAKVLWCLCTNWRSLNFRFRCYRWDLRAGVLRKLPRAGLRTWLWTVMFYYIGSWLFTGKNKRAIHLEKSCHQWLSVLPLSSSNVLNLLLNQHLARDTEISQSVLGGRCGGKVFHLLTFKCVAWFILLRTHLWMADITIF